MRAALLLLVGSPARAQRSRAPAPAAGIFDKLAEAFSNEEFDDRSAKGAYTTRNPYVTT